ncbi:MAG: RNA polymerase sporulation sigma factor SigG [Oscillospiraceae bacterium]
MYFNKVELCGVNTSKLTVLKEKEKIELLNIMKQGGKAGAAAREKMISGNLRLVLSVVQKFTQRGENLDDLFQVGCIGLMKAIDHFDLSLDVRFSTYGVPMILGEIRRFLRDNNAIRVSRSVRDLAYKAMQAKEQFQKEFGHEPAISDIAKQLNVPERQITLALESVIDPISLYEPIFNDGGDTIFVMDQIGDDNGEDNWISTILLKETLEKLSDRERKIMDLRFFSGKTQIEVASEIGISQAQVSRLEKNALEKIKKHL